MKVSLLISTYDRPDALAAVLRSVRRQTLPPFEVVIGDDGSGPDTAAVVAAAAAADMPIRHTWREHDGFRPARARNCCAAASTGDYLVIIDDDIVLHPEFLADHAKAAEKGCFVQGSRALLDERISKYALESEWYWPSLCARGVANRKNLIRSRLLSEWFGGRGEGLRGIRTCNFALWREDFVRVNGFNEDFVGWGREDSEFVARLYNSGVERKNLRFAALTCHLYHPPRSRASLANNDALLAQALEKRMRRCERGLNLHMSGEK